jgi:hypothetical protein
MCEANVCTGRKAAETERAYLAHHRVDESLGVEDRRQTDGLHALSAAPNVRGGANFKAALVHAPGT